MFREDFEFNDQATPSHLACIEGGKAHRTEPAAPAGTGGGNPAWEVAAEQELRKIPFFVRGKARRNTEQFAAQQGVSVINVETLYEAKAHFSR
ncbi:MAG: hypothetical protein P8Z31_12105 [Gammaproteobacteria bacterium]